MYRLDQVDVAWFVAETWRLWSRSALACRVRLDDGKQSLGLHEEAGSVGTDRVTDAAHVPPDSAEVVSMKWLEMGDTVSESMHVGHSAHDAVC